MKGIKIFIYSAGGILLAAALIRFGIALGGAQVMSLRDPVIGIPLRYTVLAVGGVELVAALFCLFGKRLRLQVGCLALVITNYFICRIFLFTMGCHPQATCIGTLTDPLHLSRGATGSLMTLVPFYLLLGSYVALVWLWFLNPGQNFSKTSCPSCLGYIEFSPQTAGQTIDCPHCEQAITLQQVMS